MADDKVYEGSMKFGETTDSFDADGELVASLPVLPLTIEQLNTARQSLQETRCRPLRWYPP
jgi:tRNA U55 pseudouridine synthase TruB